MHPLPFPVSPSPSSAPDRAQPLLRHARRLHRQALSTSLAVALPTLRRLLASGQFSGLSLPKLHRQRCELVRRKHLLRLLALEAGYPAWEDLRFALDCLEPQALDALTADESVATLRLWFADVPAATAWAADHGGRVQRIGRQAVVLPTEPHHG